jgi:tetratricopeptide (TPR) repeat protein
VRRTLLVAIVVTLSSAQAHAQGRSCSDFTLGPNQQISACNALITRFNDAGSATIRITRADTARYNLFLNRGAAYARSGDSVRAKADFERAVNLTTEALEEGGKPLLTEYNRSCWARAVTNIELDLALLHCNEALRLAPDAAFILDSRGFLFLRLGKTEDAIKDYDAALRTRPKQGSSLYGRGIAKFRLGDIEGAKADLFLAETLRPGTRVEFTAFGFAD